MQNKIDKKYYVWIWLGLVFACFVRNVFSIYGDISAMIEGHYVAAAVLSNVISMLISYGLAPTLVTFVLALITYYIGARRHSNYVSRNDFCYWVMIFTIAPHVLIGIVECFAILNLNVYLVTSIVLEAVLYPLSYLLMFIFIFAKRYNFNPVEKSNSFSILSTVYMVLYGIGTLGGNVSIMSYGSNQDAYNEIMQEFSQMFGTDLTMQVSDAMMICSSIAVCVFFAYLVTVIVLGVHYKKEANEFRSEDTRDRYYQAHPDFNRAYQHRDDVSDTFEEFEKAHVHNADSCDDDDDNDNVFDEFDI